MTNSNNITNEFIKKEKKTRSIAPNSDNDIWNYILNIIRYKNKNKKEEKYRKRRKKNESTPNALKFSFEK